MSRYPDQANNDLLERIPLSAGVVLDVGCHTGALGAAYRRLNPRALLLGIESDPAAAELAKRRLDQVAVVDVEQDPMPFALDRQIDCIVYGDTIEHLRDPWQVIRRHVEALSDDGTVLICVPNMDHWSFADRLLRGTWKYEPAGLLDDDAPALVQPGVDARGPGGGGPGAARCLAARVRRGQGTGIRDLDRTGADQARRRSVGLRAARRAVAICLARDETAAADDLDRGKHAAPGGRRVACACRVSVAGNAERPDGADPFRHRRRDRDCPAARRRASSSCTGRRCRAEKVRR